ncbi:hypothetical protein HYV82_04505 [Candidatus Woesearchaeota archaeon]|nr:hypothetical protein [Candidatus Woesearchaeota archaeon]
MRVNGVDGLEVRVERCNSVIGAESQMVDVLVVSDAGYVSCFIIPPQQPGERISGLYLESISPDGRRSVGFYGPLAGVVSVVFALNTGNGEYTPVRNAYYDLRTGNAVDGAELFGYKNRQA